MMKIIKNPEHLCGLTQALPHFTSVINWVLRAAIGIFKNVSPISEPWIAIVDMSNTIGTRKVLVVKRVLLNTIGNKGKAIDLEDAECIGIVSNNVYDHKKRLDFTMTHFVFQ